MTKPVRGARAARMHRARARARDGGCRRPSPGPRHAQLARGRSGPGQYRGRVLVVEDNVVNQQVAKRFLQRLGCEVSWRRTASAASRNTSADEFGLVLMDVQMPVMDGLAATREIRARERPNRHVPIVALTASAMTDELERCTAAGMNAVLAKPLELGRLRELLDRYGLRSIGAAPAAARRRAAAAPVARCRRWP